MNKKLVFVFFLIVFFSTSQAGAQVNDSAYKIIFLVDKRKKVITEASIQELKKKDLSVRAFLTDSMIANYDRISLSVKYQTDRDERDNPFNKLLYSSDVMIRKEIYKLE